MFRKQVYLEFIGYCLIFLQMFKFKIKACDARRDWIKSPEVLQNCSTGFHFPSQSEEIFEVFNISALITFKLDVQLYNIF